MISRYIIKWKIPICYSITANEIIISVVCCTQSNKHLLAKWRCSDVNIMIMTIAHFYSFLLLIHQINRWNTIRFSCQYDASSHCYQIRLNIYGISSLSHFRYKQNVKEICLSDSILLSHQCNESTCTSTSTHKSGKYQLCWALCMSKTSICRNSIMYHHCYKCIIEQRI